MSQTQEQSTKAHHRMMQQRQQSKVRAEERTNKRRDNELSQKAATERHTQIHQSNQAAEHAAKTEQPGARAGLHGQAQAQATEQGGKHGHVMTAEYRAKKKQQAALDNQQGRQHFQRHLADQQAREQLAKVGTGPWTNRAEEQRAKVAEVRAGQEAYKAAVEARHQQNLGEVRAKRAKSGA
jgi:hypothetical protein